MLQKLFTQKVIEQFKINHPELIDFTLINDLEFEATHNHLESEICINLMNLYINYMHAVNNGEDVEKAFTNAFKTISSTIEDLRYQNIDFNTAKDLITPTVSTLGSSIEGEPFVYDEISSGLNVYYSIETEKSYIYLHESHLKHFNTTKDEIRDIAIANFIKKYKKPYEEIPLARWNTTCYGFVTPDIHNATRILIKEQVQEMVNKIGGNALIAMPTSTDLLVFPSKPRGLKEFIIRHINDIYNNASSDRLCTYIFEWHNGQLLKHIY